MDVIFVELGESRWKSKCTIHISRYQKVLMETCTLICRSGDGCLDEKILLNLKGFTYRPPTLTGAGHQ